MVLCGAIAGVVVAAAFFPGVALSGLMAKESLEQFDQLPAELHVDDGPQVSFVYAADGTTRIAAMYDENRRNVPLHDISPHMLEAILAAEDRNFYEHNGVDVRGIARAFVANTAADQVTQGASTVTQQFVRLSLTYFSEDLQDVVDATEETNGRKLREARYAIAVEQQLTKEEILNGYLNLAYFGEGAYGIFAASQVYFDKRPAELEIDEAAFLAGLVQAPSQFSPSEGGLAAATERRNWVLDQMVDTGAITRAEAAEGKRVELDLEPERQPNMCVGVAINHWGFFCDYFYRWWLEQETFGATRWEREQRLRSGGFHVVTTLDVDTQEAAKEHVEEQLATGDEHALMVAAVEPGTGKIRAMSTNRNFAIDDPQNPQNGPHTNPQARDEGVRGSYPNTTNPLISGGGDIDGYQGGSTFKLFTQIAALEQGLPLSTNIDSPTQITTNFYAEPGTSAACGDRWCPVNYPDQEPGNYNMWTAFGQSINTYYVQLVDRVGADNAVDVAKRLGIKFRASGTEENPQDAQYASPGRSSSWGPFTLGVSATTPLDLANAYATVSAEGVHCEPIPVEEIRTQYGESLDVADPDCERVLDEDVALAAIDTGRCVTGAGSELGGCSSGSGTARQAHDTVGKPVWGKTGTSDGVRAYSTVLSTKQLVVAGQLTDPDWAQTNQQMETELVRNAVMRILRDGTADHDSEDWDVPDDRELVRGSSVTIPNVSCQSVSQAESRLADAGFATRVAGGRVDSSCPAGSVAGTSPSGETSPGDTITIQISNGSGAGNGGPGNGNGGPGNGNGNGGPGNGNGPPGDNGDNDDDADLGGNTDPGDGGD
ncbi:transglycosylase domain-containing protein [Natronosporangium hydrolyticum]|uniref:transglycosylase domain-containing protein n=1 Tax=Natronosporangium hydrolyticum TaxID=2811111 RepID=UPI001EFA2A43|nr:transglycosylase domain-containing protein [Natronosporangium hydrolyticum]